jgi:hypothetical protein
MNIQFADGQTAPEPLGQNETMPSLENLAFMAFDMQALVTRLFNNGAKTVADWKIMMARLTDEAVTLEAERARDHRNIDESYDAKVRRNLDQQWIVHEMINQWTGQVDVAKPPSPILEKKTKKIQPLLSRFAGAMGL